MVEVPEQAGLHTIDEYIRRSTGRGTVRNFVQFRPTYELCRRLGPKIKIK
jgi:hypothetical protein